MKKDAAHIAHVLPFPAVGGTEHAARRLAEATRDAGFRHSFLVLSGCGEVADFFRAANFEVFEYPHIEPRLRGSINYYRASSEMARTVRRIKPDVLHCADYGGAMFASLAGLLARVPLISHVRSRHDQISRRDQLFLRFVQHWLFVSHDARRHFAVKVPNKRATVLHDGIKVEPLNQMQREANRRSVIAEFGLAEDVKIIGTLARVAPQKDFFTLARAVQKLVEVEPKIKVVVVGSISRQIGDKQHYAEVLRLLRELNIEDRFIFTDFRRDTTRFLQAFDVFALSTHIEGFPLVNLEAMAQAVPIVATNVGGVSEAIIDNQTGLLCEHENVDDLAGKLRRLLFDQSFSRQIAVAGYEYVKANLSEQQFAHNAVDFYRRFLQLN